MYKLRKSPYKITSEPNVAYIFYSLYNLLMMILNNVDLSLHIHKPNSRQVTSNQVIE